MMPVGSITTNREEHYSGGGPLLKVLAAWLESLNVRRIGGTRLLRSDKRNAAHEDQARWLERWMGGRI